MSDSHLALKDTTKYYKKFKAVDSVNLEVKKGEFLTILGPSGSGKTSLLKLIAGFEELSDGFIYLNGEEISKKKAYQRNIGMLFQNYALFPHMTVRQNISYPLQVRKYGKEEIANDVKKVLSLVQLEEFADRYPNQLSGGQQQRVALARAIVFNPPLLLLDEPLGALDKNLRKTMQLEIKHLQKRTGITTITVTHDQEEALTMSDRVCVMNAGKIEQISSPTKIYQEPSNEFVAKFIGEINLLRGKIVSTKNKQTMIKLNKDSNIILKSNELKSSLDNEVFIAIRPENIQLVDDTNYFENTLKVTIQEVIFLGDTLKVRSITSFGEEIMFNLNSQMLNHMQPGKEIHIGWNTNEATLIPAESSHNKNIEE